MLECMGQLYSRRLLYRTTACAVMLCMLADERSRADEHAGLAACDRGGKTTPVVGFTMPFRTVTLAALQTGRIRELPAAEGEFVQPGQVLIHLDDAVQRARTEIARALSESTLAIEIARVRMEQYEHELKRIQDLAGASTVSVKELSDARANAEAARLALDKARFEHEQSVREYALQRTMLDEMHIRAPFAGYVAEHLKQAGDTIEQREGVLTLVQLDPLVVTMDCPCEQIAFVKPGQRVRVHLSDTPAAWRVGEVFFVNRVADPASQTFKVKVRVSNADAAWMAGVRVDVDLGASGGVAGPETGK